MSSAMIERRQHDRSSSMNLRGKLEENASLARYTSWKVGGVADVLFQPADLEDLQKFLSTLEDSLPITWLGQRYQRTD